MPPLPTTFDSCNGRGIMTNGNIGTVGGLRRAICEPIVGKSLRRRRFELTGRADLVGCVAGEHLVDRGRVIEQADRRVAHRAEHRHLVGHLGQLRQQLRELETLGFGVDGLEDAADVVGHIVLGIPQIEMARSALEIDEDHALGLAEAGTAVALLGGSLGRLELEEPAERQAEDRRAADAQQIAPCVAIAGVFAGPAGDDEHGGTSRRVGRRESGGEPLPI